MLPGTFFHMKHWHREHKKINNEQQFGVHNTHIIACSHIHAHTNKVAIFMMVFFFFLQQANM